MSGVTVPGGADMDHMRTDLFKILIEVVAGFRDQHLHLGNIHAKVGIDRGREILRAQR